ncbi:integrase catalytic domain-containing protein [Trichonephila clavipes]|nr:integrase catalytic domain-containing protein [Trichonephila clavipes]
MFDSSKPDDDVVNFVSKLKSHMQSLHPKPPKHHGKRPVFIHPGLLEATHVFLRRDMLRRPLQQPYDGPFKVLQRKDKVFSLTSMNETPATVEPNATASTPATVESDPTASTPTQPSTRSGRKVHLPTSYTRAFGDVILNHPPSPNYHTTPTGGRFSSRQIERASLQVFSGTGIELVTKQATIRYLCHSATAALISHRSHRFDSSKPDDDVVNFVSKLKSHVQSLHPKPPKHHSKRPVFIHPGLLEATHVFLCRDMLRRPLQQPYDGPFKVLQRKDKVFFLDINGKRVSVSIDRCKPAFFLNTEDLQLPQTKNEIPATVEPNATASTPATVESDPTASTPTQPSTRSGRKVHLPTRYR